MFEHRWRRRHRDGHTGRRPKPVIITLKELPEKFEPTPKRSTDPIYLELAEVEALKLVELEKLSFEEAAARMNISRNTVWRLAKSAREKLAKAIIESKEIIIGQE